MPDNTRYICTKCILTLILVMAGGCGSAPAQNYPAPEAQTLDNRSFEEARMSEISETKRLLSNEDSAFEGTTIENTDTEVQTMNMKIDGRIVPVLWEDNASVEELRSLAREGLSIQMSMYGGFEQVGSVGTNLTREDQQMTTGAGDVVLYSGNRLVVFYGNNSWAYTRLGRIDLSEEELKTLLGNGDVVISLEIEE